MSQSSLFGRFFLVTGLIGGLAMLAYQPSPPATTVALKPVAAKIVPVFLIDRLPRPAASDIRSNIFNRDPPDHCFAPRSQANAHQRLACG
jgi:hypothetical protein